MGKDGRLYFHEKVLRGGVERECFWENFDDKVKRRIYLVNGFSSFENRGRLKYSINYLDCSEQFSKTPEETAWDLEATARDLIDFGKRIGITLR